MKTKFILLGDQAVRYFKNEDWEYLEGSILRTFNGDIISWNEEDGLEELLEQLRGWSDFLILGEEDLKEIEKNTKIEIEWN